MVPLGEEIRISMAEGKKEDALFYLCSAVRVLDEKFRNLALPHPEYEEKELLQKGRTCGNYLELQSAFFEIIMEYLKKTGEVRQDLTVTDKLFSQNL